MGSRRKQASLPSAGEEFVITGAWLRSGYRPIEGLQFRSLNRGMWEVHVVGQIEFAENSHLLLGPALALTLDSITRRGHAPDGAVLVHDEHKARLRQSLAFGVLASPWIIRVVGSPYPEAEGRLDIGVEGDVL